MIDDRAALVKNFATIVLVHPEIPGNTGTIGRLAIALNIPIILIKPLGFSLDEKSVRRAGLDYWKYVSLTVMESWEEFLSVHRPPPDQLFFFENHQSQTYDQAKYSKNCFLVFGSETKGIPAQYMGPYQNNIFALPMYSPHIRSLNLSNVVSVVTYEVHRQLYCQR